MADIERGRELIAKAIELNPGAHFGREDVQLMIMDWVVEAAPDAGLRQSLGEHLGDKDDAERLRKGLLGLVMLGNAWESIDTFEAIGFISNQRLGEGAVGELALERLRELKATGRVSIATESYDYSRHGAPGRIRAEYKELRADADAWAAERDAFVLKRLAEGRHPDTHKDFWKGYTERPARPLDRDSLADTLNRVAYTRPEIVLLTLLGVLVVLVALAIRARRRRR